MTTLKRIGFSTGSTVGSTGHNVLFLIAEIPGIIFKSALNSGHFYLSH